MKLVLLQSAALQRIHVASFNVKSLTSSFGNPCIPGTERTLVASSWDLDLGVAVELLRPSSSIHWFGIMEEAEEGSDGRSALAKCLPALFS